MPDRQRHGRLSDDAEPSRPAWELAARQGREPDRSDPTADPAQSRRAPLPPPTGEPADPGSGFDTGQDADPMADTTLLRGVTLPQPTVEPADPGSGFDTGRDADPMADTTLLRPVTFPLPTAEPAGPDSGSDAGWDADAAEADGPDAAPIRSRSATRSAARSARSRSPLAQQRDRLAASALRHRRRLAVAMAGVTAVGALLALPPVRAELRDSFTRKPQPYTALYFTSRPQVDGTVLTVPVSVHAVDTGTDVYSVHVWTVDTKGQVGDSHMVDLKWDGQALSAVVSMPVNPAAEYVWVALNGSGQTLHYKIAVA